VKVVDANVLVFALVADGPIGNRARRALRASELAAPELLDLEVAETLRKLVSTRQVAQQRASAALADLVRSPVERFAHSKALSRCWELRHNVTMYDAAYVALAEALDAALVTTDRRLARSSGPRCDFELLG
jgi:predicted nucleic acid-binding protein